MFSHLTTASFTTGVVAYRVWTTEEPSSKVAKHLVESKVSASDPRGHPSAGHLSHEDTSCRAN